MPTVQREGKCPEVCYMMTLSADPSWRSLASGILCFRVCLMAIHNQSVYYSHTINNEVTLARRASSQFGKVLIQSSLSR